MKPLVVESLTKSFGGFDALSQVSLDLEPGERRAIIGPNGAGKTTLFNIVTGLLPPSAGRIHLFGQDVTKLPMHRRSALGMARTFQINSLFPKLSILENVALAIQAHNPCKYVTYRPWRSFRSITEGCEQLLKEWGLWDKREELVETLSYGDQRQIEIVLAMASKPKLLMMDEPTAGLSTAETTAVTELMGRIDANMTILLIEHDMDVALQVATRITVLHYGQVLAEGSLDEIQANAQVTEIYLGTDHN